MWESLETYFICGPMGWVTFQGAMTVCNVELLGAFKAARRYLPPGWLIYADFARLWNLGGLLLMIIRTGSLFPTHTSKIPWNRFLQHVVARLPSSVVKMGSSSLGILVDRRLSDSDQCDTARCNHFNELLKLNDDDVFVLPQNYKRSCDCMVLLQFRGYSTQNINKHIVARLHPFKTLAKKLVEILFVVILNTLYGSASTIQWVL